MQEITQIAHRLIERLHPHSPYIRIAGEEGGGLCIDRNENWFVENKTGGCYSPIGCSANEASLAELFLMVSEPNVYITVAGAGTPEDYLAENKNRLLKALLNCMNEKLSSTTGY